MDRREAIRAFIKANLNLLLSKEFVEDGYRLKKKQFFVDQIRRGVGNPPDSEIAEELLRYILPGIKDEDSLSQKLDLPFLRKNIHNPDAYKDLRKVSQSNVDIDLGQLESEGYKSKVKESLKNEVIEDRAADIERAMKQRMEEYASLPSIFDAVNYVEPEPADESTIDAGAPWWRRLGLADNPFPSLMGLDRIPPSLYDRVVCRSETITTYLKLLAEDQSELFKNRVILGKGGSGKTVVFDYLAVALHNEGIISLRVNMEAKPDVFALLIEFKDEIVAELCGKYHELKGIEINPSSPALGKTPDDAIRWLMKQLEGPDGRSRFVIFVDELHRYRGGINVVMDFIIQLQVFTENLKKNNRNLELAFYVAGVPDWEITIKVDASMFLGSIPSTEVLSPVTAEAGIEMFNRRFRAYSPDPANPRTVDEDKIRQIFREMEKKGLDLTYRQFINEVLEKFRQNDFDALSGKPMDIPREELEKIRARIEADTRLKGSFDKLIYGGGIQTAEERGRAIRVLSKISLGKGYLEDDRYFKDNEKYFHRLEQSQLTQKSLGPGRKTRWVVCQSLQEKGNEIYRDFRVLPVDYLSIIYGGRNIRTSGGQLINEELSQIENFLKSSASKEVKPFVRESMDLHQQIMADQANLVQGDVDISKLLENCKKSLLLITKAALVSQGQDFAKKSDDEILQVWDGRARSFWYPLEEVADFQNSVREAANQREKAALACSRYKQAYTQIFNFVKEQSDLFRYFPISTKGLGNQEVKLLNVVGAHYVNMEYYAAAKEMGEVVESKMRRFLFNLFRLLYGENRSDRLRRLHDEQRKRVLENLAKDSSKGLQISSNEFEQLDRYDYTYIILPKNPIAQQNWAEVFSLVFKPLSQLEVEEFLNKFSKIQTAVQHLKTGAITQAEQTMVYDFIVRSADMMRRINSAYALLLQRCFYKGANKGEFFFSLFDLKDKASLTPIIVSRDVAARLINILAEKSEFEVDLENPSAIEQYLGVPYTTVVAFLASFLHLTDGEFQATGFKLELVQWNGSLGIFKVISGQGRH